MSSPTAHAAAPKRTSPQARVARLNAAIRFASLRRYANGTHTRSHRSRASAQTTTAIQPAATRSQIQGERVTGSDAPPPGRPRRETSNQLDGLLQPGEESRAVGRDERPRSTGH